MVQLGIIKEDKTMSDNINNTNPPSEPLTREEEYLSAIAGVTSSSDIPAEPLTRIEKYLNKIVENGGGGGGGGTVNNAKITIQKNGVDVESFTLNQSTDETINISGVAEVDSNGQIEAATVKAGALEDGMTATTQATSDDSTKLATTAYVHDVVDALPEPMIFTGSITLTADSTDTSTAAITVSAPASAADIVKGYTYKVTSIASSPVYTGSIKVGDTLIAAKNAPTVSASWVADTDWTIVPSGDETGYVVGLPSGTSSGQLMAFGTDGYTAANSGVSVANNTTGISDVDTAVPTSKAVIHKTAHAATLDDYTPETGTYTDKITTADTIDSAIKKLDTRSRANETNILLKQDKLKVETATISLDQQTYTQSGGGIYYSGAISVGSFTAIYSAMITGFQNIRVDDYIILRTTPDNKSLAILTNKSSFATGAQINVQTVGI